MTIQHTWGSQIHLAFILQVLMRNNSTSYFALRVTSIQCHPPPSNCLGEPHATTDCTYQYFVNDLFRKSSTWCAVVSASRTCESCFSIAFSLMLFGAIVRADLSTAVCSDSVAFIRKNIVVQQQQQEQHQYISLLLLLIPRV